MAKGGRAVLAWTPPSPFNPFPSMLYAQAKQHGVTPVGVQASELGTVRRSAETAGARVVFHHHWTGWVLGDESNRSAALKRRDRGLEVLEQLGEAPLIWTVHNSMPHECWFEDLEASYRQHLADRADIVHVMNPQTPEVVAPHYRLAPEKIVALEHPSYEHASPEPPGRAEARRKLGLTNEGVWIGALGQVRGYKRLDLLLDALDRTEQVRLLVAGATGADEESRRQSDRAASHERVVRIVGHLDDTELSAALASVDAVAIPYESGLNSGVLALARTFGVPAIVADAPHLRSISDPGSAFFRPGEPDDLARALVSQPTVSGHYRSDTPERFAQLVAELGG